jgi:hypothetical protein
VRQNAANFKSSEAVTSTCEATAPPPLLLLLLFAV